MNYCRTCRHWAVKPGAIGVGYCNNFDAAQRYVPTKHPITCQDFGCVFHEPGACQSEIDGFEEQKRQVDEFLAERRVHWETEDSITASNREEGKP